GKFLSPDGCLGFFLRLGLDFQFTSRQLSQGLGNLVIALSKLLLVKLITIQRRLQSKEQFWPPVSFQAFGNGFFARYNPPMLEFGQLLAIALSGQERFDNGETRLSVDIAA